MGHSQSDKNMQNNASREIAAGAYRPTPADTMQIIDFQTDPSRYRHWRIERDGDIAYLIMDVDQAGGLFDGYELNARPESEFLQVH